MDKLAGKVAVITGASSGMGLATAQLFVNEGAYVFITGRNQDLLDTAVRSIGSHVTGVLADSGNLSDLDRLFDIVKTEKGHIDILFASAGSGEATPLGHVSEEQFDRTFALNAKGTFFTIQKALPLFRDGGSIIMTGTIAAVKGFPYLSVYSASKAVLESYAKSWTPELSARNIRVNVIHPGVIETRIFDQFTQQQQASFVSQSALGRPGQPGEIAGTALFLASSDSSYINGTAITVDGGGRGLSI